MIRKIIYLLISLNAIKNSSSYDNFNYDENVNYPKQEITVIFPKYNIKIAAAIQDALEEVYHHDKPFLEELDTGTFTDINNWNNNNYQPEYDSGPQDIPTYYLKPPNYPSEDSEEQLQPYYPVITREPISTRKPCIQKIFPKIELNPNARNSEDSTKVGSVRTHKKDGDTWFFSPAWDSNNINILREANPRGVISSHTHFVKIHKPDKKIFISHNKHIIKGHDHHHHHLHQHFGGSPNIIKKTNIHVHNRNVHQERKTNEEIIGSHLFAAPRWKRTSSRNKRNIADLARLAVDHRTKLDMQRTAENVGAATRNLFEKDYSPAYHLRNALSSAQDTFYSLMNVRPSGIIIPCSYKIVPANDVPNDVSSPMVGGINPNIYKIRGPPPAPLPEDGTDEGPLYEGNNPDSDYEQYYDYNEDPLQQIGTKLRDSVQWMHRTAEHAADTLHHAREVFVAARKHWPKLLLPYAGAVEVTRPQIGYQNADIVGSSRNSEFVGVGRMMDYLGMTDRKSDTPRVGGFRVGGPRVSGPRISEPRLISEEEMTLQKAKDVLGAPTYRIFLDEVKKHLDIKEPKTQIIGIPRQIPNSNLQAKLALDRIKTSLKLQKAKLDLKRLHAPKLPVVRTPVIPKLPTKLLLPLRVPKPIGSNLLKEPLKLNLKEPLIKPINKNPLLKASVPKTSLIQPIKPLETKNVNSDLDKIRASLIAHKKLIKKNNIIQTTTAKPTVSKPLEKLRLKLYQKYNISNSDTSDILGKTLRHVQYSEEVGAPRGSGIVETVPSPVFTTEMKTPFMGLATKHDIEEYFEKLYCPDCKMGDIK